jgi:uncharacterized protein YdaU (DUF1376 family)
MPLFVADYLADTIHLSTMEHGAYLLLLMAMWRVGPLPDDDAKLAKFARCSGRQWASVKGAIMPMMRAENGLVSHGRLEAERAKYADFVCRQSRAGAASAKAKALKTNDAGSTGVPTEINQPEPELKEKKEVSEAKASSPESELFETAWRSCTDTMRRRAGSKTKTRKAWDRCSRRASESLLLAALGNYRQNDPDVGRTGGPSFEGWLRNGEWEVWIPGSEPSRPPPTAEIVAGRMQHWRDTGEWRPNWGEPPRLAASA